MNIPATDDCYAMICRMDMMDHIVSHSIRVCQVATLISKTLIHRGVSVNHQLVTAAALLHDITKTRSFTTRENHAESGDAYLRDHGYPEVGDIVGQHVRLRDYSIEGAPAEAEIVNYADKRVLHEDIVSLDKRMAYIVERYGGDRTDLFEKLQWLWERSVDLEKKLFAHLDFTPEVLSGRLSEKDFKSALAAYALVKERQA